MAFNGTSLRYSVATSLDTPTFTGRGYFGKGGFKYRARCSGRDMRGKYGRILYLRASLLLYDIVITHGLNMSSEAVEL